MTKNESLAILQSVYDQIASMSDEELFDYMMDSSDTFREDVQDAVCMCVSTESIVSCASILIHVVASHHSDLSAKQLLKEMTHGQWQRKIAYSTCVV